MFFFEIVLGGSKGAFLSVCACVCVYVCVCVCVCGGLLTRAPVCCMHICSLCVCVCMCVCIQLAKNLLKHQGI